MQSWPTRTIANPCAADHVLGVILRTDGQPKLVILVLVQGIAGCGVLMQFPVTSTGMTRC